VHIFLREHCQDGSWAIFGEVASRFFYAHSCICITFSLIEFQMGVIDIVSCYNDSRTRGARKVENHCSTQICSFKKTFNLIYIMLKILKCLIAELRLQQMSPSKARANEVQRRLATNNSFWFRSPATRAGVGKCGAQLEILLRGPNQWCVGILRGCIKANW